MKTKEYITGKVLRLHEGSEFFFSIPSANSGIDLIDN